MILGIYIDNQRLDLFDDEQIKVKSSVLDIQDIEKNTTDYSNSFTVPASATNNKIFKHYYNPDIDGGFDARMKHPARIELGGIPFKVGNVILQSVKMLHGAPSSYMLTFFGDLASLSDIFGDTKLIDLAFSNLPDQEQTSDNVKAKMEGTLDDIICPLIGKKRYYYNKNTQDYNVNNLATGIRHDTGIDWKELRLATRLECVVDAIEDHFGLTFSDDLFHSALFSKLYLYLDNDSLDYASADIVVDGITDLPFLRYGNIELIYSTSSVHFDIVVDIVPVQEDIPYTVSVYNSNDEVVGSKIISEGGTSELVLDRISLNTSADDDTLYCKVESEGLLTFNATIELKVYDNTLNLSGTYTGNSDNKAFVTHTAAELMPDITVSDFVKGLINAFRCVVIKEENDVYINNVEDYYNVGNIIDLTNYADNSAVPIYRPDLLNKIDYSFQDGTTLLQETFNDINGTYYGNEELSIYDDSGDLISGSSKSISLPFEQMVYESLIDKETGNKTSVCIGASIDSDGEPAIMGAHIFYAVKRGDFPYLINMILDTGENDTIDVYSIMPSHAESDTVNGTAFLFGSEFDEYNGDELTDNLYSTYHSPYITKLFNKKTRRYELTCSNVPLSILTTLQLNDTIKVRTDYFRINSNTINLTTGSITLDLLR